MFEPARTFSSICRLLFSVQPHICRPDRRVQSNLAASLSTRNHQVLDVDRAVLDHASNVAASLSTRNQEPSDVQGRPLPLQSGPRLSTRNPRARKPLHRGRRASMWPRLYRRGINGRRPTGNQPHLRASMWTRLCRRGIIQPVNAPPPVNPLQCGRVSVDAESVGMVGRRPEFLVLQCGRVSVDAESSMASKLSYQTAQLQCGRVSVDAESGFKSRPRRSPRRRSCPTRSDCRGIAGPCRGRSGREGTFARGKANPRARVAAPPSASTPGHHLKRARLAPAALCPYDSEDGQPRSTT